MQVSFDDYWFLYCSHFESKEQFVSYNYNNLVILSLNVKPVYFTEPKTPKHLRVEATSSKELSVTWDKPTLKMYTGPTHYVVVAEDDRTKKEVHRKKVYGKSLQIHKHHRYRYRSERLFQFQSSSFSDDHVCLSKVVLLAIEIPEKCRVQKPLDLMVKKCLF